MNYEQLRSLVGGANPQDVSYQDIVSGIQSQYAPQLGFMPTRSLLDSIGALVPDQQRIAYGSLLQAEPMKLPTPMKKAVTDTLASVDSGDIKVSNVDTGKITGNTAIDNTLVYNNNLTGGTTDTSSVNSGLFGTKVTGTDVANVAGTVAPIAALAGNSDLATDNTPMTVNALLGATNPTLGLVNTIASNLTGYSLGDIANGLLNTPEGTVGEYGLLGAANIAKTTDASRKAAGVAYDNLDANTLRVLAELGDQEAIATINSASTGGSTYNPLTELGTARGNSYYNLFTPVSGGSGGGKANIDLNRTILEF